MMKSVLCFFALVLFSSSALAVEVLEGKTPAGDRCSVRIDLAQDLVGFAGDGVAFGFPVKAKTFAEALKKGQGTSTFIGEDGAVNARLTLNFSEAGNLESASYSQRTFLRSKRVKCRI